MFFQTRAAKRSCEPLASGRRATHAFYLACSLGLNLVATGCLEAPSVGRAAAPNVADQGAPVMGSSTTNSQVKAKVDILEDLLDGKIDPAQAADRIDQTFKDLPKEEQDKRLANLREALRELPGTTGKGRAMAQGPDRDMIFARLYFSERRFIDSATRLSRVLDVDPVYPGARNLLARCFFFLGNPDRTIQELQFILKHPTQGNEQGERLDALFLLGAAVLESPGTSRANLQSGLEAWTAYLQEAPDSPQRPQVEEGLKTIEAGLRGEGRLAQGDALRKEATMDAPQNVMGGQASFRGQPAPAGPGGPAGQGATPERVKNLPADASPYARTLATGLDALDLGDLATAEVELKKAEALKANEPESLVGLGRVFVRSGRIDEALRTFGEAIKLHPNYMPAWHYNGMAHMMSGDPRQAAESWEHIMQADPAYAQKFSLDRRAAVARRAARGR